MYLQRRVQPGECLQGRHQLAQAVFLGGGDAQAATQFAMLGAGVVDGQARLVEHLHAALVEAFASIGQGHPPGAAAEQRNAQLGLQPLEVEADYRTRLAEGVGGGAEGTAVDHGAKGFEAVEADHGRRSYCQIRFDSLCAISLSR